jgi:nucleotide-binding universal stress UspA family protein
MYEDILFPFDGSDGAADVLHHAAEIANWANGTIRLLYVADTTEVSVTRTGGEVVDGLIEHGEEILETATATLDTLGTDYATDIVQGTPAETIVDYAERRGHDVIVMPTQGRTGLSRYLLGSVTEKVVRLSETPVLTARMQPDEKLTYPYGDILVPTDGSSAAESAAVHALNLAATLDSTVHVISVVDTGSLGPDVRSETLASAGKDAATEAVATIENAAERQGIDDVHTHVEHGSPDSGILEYIDDEEIDAVVMGTTGRRGVERVLLGSVAEKTVRSAPVPVVTVPETDDAGTSL